MKWIGQHIWDFISRFRSDVYLEDLADPGSDTDKFLVVDTNNKVGYRTGAEVLSDIGASSESTDLEFNGSTANGVLTYGGAAQIDVESTLTYAPGVNKILYIGDDDDGLTQFMRQSHSDGAGGDLRVLSGAASSGSSNNNQSGGDLSFFAGVGTGNAAASQIRFNGPQEGSSGDSAQDSNGIASMYNSSTSGKNFRLNAANDVSNDFFNIACGVNAATTITTTDASGGPDADLTFDIDGDIVLDSATGIIKTGSTTFVNNSGVIQVATQGIIDHDSLANFVANEHIDWTSFSGTPIHRGNITTLDQITGGVHFNSISAENPVVKIENKHTTTDQSGELRFIKDAADVVDGEYLGQITFYGDNDAGTPEEIKYCEIIGTAADVSDGAEGGFMYLNVASYDGEMQSGIQIFSGNGEDEVDVNIGNTATSLTTINGDLLVNQGKATIDTRKFTKTGTTHFEYQGDVLYFGDGSTTQGDLCYLKENGEWGQADADGEATSDDEDRDAMGMLAIALGNDPDVDGMFIRGTITMNYDMGDVGNPLYVKVTPGQITHSPSTASGDFIRLVGYCLDDTNGQIYFNPDSSWVEIA
tara:strand:- start:1728 stop:3485 length:1758 start_codon:yes stop_codon:yes gene_type:complete